MQSRYYDPEIGRFINADALISTGQGILGNNMFAYCLNNPVTLSDVCGTAANIALSDDIDIISSPTDEPSSGGGGIGIVVVALPAPQAPAIPLSKSGTDVGKNDSDDRIYTVYFLYKKDGSTEDIVYVGRVKTANFDSRMAYHRTKGRLLSFSIPGLTWAECRGLEQVGMVYFHTINRNNTVNNQIRGVSPQNGLRKFYLNSAKAFWIINGCKYILNMPDSYWLNWTENEFLNMKTP